MRDWRSGRRRLVQGGLIGGVALALDLESGSGRLRATEHRVTASGAGVNLKLMPDENGGLTVPLREPFAFDTTYAQCLVEDNPTRFAMDTYELGRVVIEPHQFFMAMYAENLGLDSIHREADGSLTASLSGVLACSTYAGTATTSVGSREASEHARFRIEATDGGYGPTAPPDRFAFTVFFDPREAPINHAIFGPEAIFTGEMVRGKVTIGPPRLEAITEATPTP